jgi:phospholipid/cholesterol/gamma-HCH transport system substrate-binding protein
LTLGDQIRKRLREFLALLGIVASAAAVGGYILAHQRITVPSWVPALGDDSFVLKAEFATAQAVTPGQGQSVTVAGVQVGRIERVDLVNGRAVVTMRIDPDMGRRIRHDATLLLRPKTGLKDMTVAMDPGTTKSPRLSSGSTLPISATLPDVNLDEFLSALDGDTRDYLQLLLNGAGTGLGGNGRELSALLRRFDPTARNIAKITHLAAQRDGHIKHAIGNFSALMRELGAKDQQLTEFVRSSRAVLDTFAQNDASLRETLALLPGALAHTKAGLGDVGKLTSKLGPTTRRLQPTADSLAGGMKAAQPFLRETTPVIQDELRPFARTAKPTFDALRPAVQQLAPATKNLTTTFSVLNRFLNELAYNPGSQAPGFLFFVPWGGHNLNSVVSVQDATGPMQRGLVMLSCQTISTDPAQNLLEGAAKVNPTVRLVIDLLNPADPKYCPPPLGATPPGGTTRAGGG